MTYEICLKKSILQDYLSYSLGLDNKTVSSDFSQSSEREVIVYPVSRVFSLWLWNTLHFLFVCFSAYLFVLFIDSKHYLCNYIWRRQIQQ